MTASAIGNAKIGDATHVRPSDIPRAPSNRIAIFTAILGDYDTLKLPYDEWLSQADFYCFTDRVFRNPGGWRLVTPDFHSTDPTRIARHYKTHPHVYFSGYEVSIWVDGNIALIDAPNSLADTIGSNVDVVSFRHPWRRKIEEEAAECQARRRDRPETMRDQIARYQAEGYKQNSDLIETSVVVFRHKVPAVSAFLSRWSREIERGSKRDQLSVNYAIDRTPGLRVAYFSDKSTHASRLVKVVKHLDA